MKNVSTKKVYGIDDVNRELDSIRFALNALDLYRGSGSPEGILAARIGSIYINELGGALTTLWIKTGDDKGKTLWKALQTI